ncbi:MAG: Ig-like domain-containing protein, partial [Gemmatimonadaceae bacterium]
MGFALAAGVLACDRTASTTPTEPVAGVATSLAIVPASLYLQPGQERTLTVEARDATGAVVATPTLTWRTDAPTVATVSSTGRVQAVAPGNARLTASAGTLATAAPVGVTGANTGVAQWRAARSTFNDQTLLGIWDDGAGTSYAVGQNGSLLRATANGYDLSYDAQLFSPERAKILARGFDGVFLDTVDTGTDLERRDRARFAGATLATIDLVRAIKRRYPAAVIVLNRGYDILPTVENSVDMVLAESLVTAW